MSKYICAALLASALANNDNVHSRSVTEDDNPFQNEGEVLKNSKPHDSAALEVRGGASILEANAGASVTADELDEKEGWFKGEPKVVVSSASSLSSSLQSGVVAAVKNMDVQHEYEVQQLMSVFECPEWLATAAFASLDATLPYSEANKSDRLNFAAAYVLKQREPFEFFMKPLAGDQFKMDVHSQDTIGGAKDRLMRLIGHHTFPYGVDFRKNGVKLEDSKTFEDYQIGAIDNRVHLTGRFPPGGKIKNAGF